MNAKFTKLNKNYVVLATLIAALGVIFALFFAINSFADDNAVEVNNDPIVAQDANADAQEDNATYNYTFKGTIKLYTGDAVPNCYFSIMKETEQFHYEMICSGTSDNSGNFSIDYSCDDANMTVQVQVNYLPYSPTPQKGISGNTDDVSATPGQVSFGDVTCYYYFLLSLSTDPFGSDYGTWYRWNYDRWIEAGMPGNEGISYQGTASFAVEQTNQVRFSFTDKYGSSDSRLYKFEAKTPYTFSNFKFMQNMQEITGPDITGSTITATAVCTGQVVTHALSGKLVDPLNNPVKNAGLTVTSISGDVRNTTTNDQGVFSTPISSIGDSVKVTSISGGLYGDKNRATISYNAANASEGLYVLTEDKDVGDLTCYYNCGLTERINGSGPAMTGVEGTWNIPIIPGNANGSLGISFRSCEVTANNNQVIFNYTDPNGQQQQWAWTFNVNPGYEIQGFTVDKADNPMPGNASMADLTTCYWWAINVNVTKIVPKHAVTFDSNTIESVYANGHNLTSGEEVAEGTVLYITPKYPTDAKVTKILVNNAVCPTGVYTLGTSAVNIVADYFDIATITGTVTVDKVVNGQAKINLNSLFVDKAYAAEALEGATVTFTQNSDGWYTSDLTNAEGYFALNVVEHEAGVLTVVKDGYEPFTKEFSAEELDGEVEIAPVLTVAAQPENVNGSAQTGDNMPYGIALVVLAVSAFAVYRTARRPKGAHVK